MTPAGCYLLQLLKKRRDFDPAHLCKIINLHLKGEHLVFRSYRKNVFTGTCNASAHGLVFIHVIFTERVSSVRHRRGFSSHFNHDLSVK